MTGLVYNTTVTFTIKGNEPLCPVFGKYTLRAGGVYNFVTLKKG